MTLYIGVCEDDEIHRRILINFIEKFIKSKEIDFDLLEFSSGEQLLENYPNRLDILFLDIQNHLNKCILSLEDKETNYLIITNKNSLIKIDLNSVLYIETDNRELIVFEIDKSYRIKVSMRKIITG